MALPYLEQLKQVAEVIGYGQTIVGGGAVIFGAVFAFLRWGLKPFRWAASKIRSNKKQPVERPLRFVLDENRSLWSEITAGDRHGTNVFGHWHVTNLSGRNVVLLRTRLENYSAETAHVATKGPDAEQRVPTFDNRNPILQGTMAQVISHFSFFPAICDGRQPLIADVIFTDNYEEEHRVRSVRFLYRGRNSLKTGDRDEIDYFDRLAQGSKYHRAKRTTGELVLYSIEDADPQRAEFRKIAQEARKQALAAGHDFDPHNSSRDSHGWDRVRIIFK